MIVVQDVDFAYLGVVVVCLGVGSEFDRGVDLVTLIDTFSLILSDRVKEGIPEALSCISKHVT